MSKYDGIFKKKQIDTIYNWEDEKSIKTRNYFKYPLQSLLNSKEKTLKINNIIKR